VGPRHKSKRESEKYETWVGGGRERKGRKGEKGEGEMGKSKNDKNFS